MKKTKILLLMLVAVGCAYGREYHVSVKGDDANMGTEKSPFRTIGRAALAAYAGDVITVHEGTYREWVNPPRGGTGEDERIVYRAAPGEYVEIKGSEIVDTWTRVTGDVWKATIPNSFFGDYNPFVDQIYGDWFDGQGRVHHTGEVFLNNRSLYERESLDKLRNPEVHPRSSDPEASKYVWYCESDAENTSIWANFHRLNPNKERVEISVRRTCFYPEKPGVNYLTIQGFHISQAASQWAAPTAEQIGMVATHWNKGWIIENNVISNAKCSGITLGKERGSGHNVWLDDMTIDGSLHYIEVTFRALSNGWHKDNIGSHIVRNNEIFSCEQTGICGSMGAAFSIVENNYIHDIWEKRQFDGAEIAGIKFHAAIDTQIRNNRVCRTGRGMWLDWMAQGVRISRNVVYGNDLEDIFFEVDHGPYLVDNNIFASTISVWDVSQGGAYVHNLFAGRFRISQEKSRYTPYHLPHRTDIAGLSIILNGDNRFYNNLFIPVDPDADLRHGNAGYDKSSYPNFMDGNAYYRYAIQSGNDEHFVSQPDFDPKFKLEDRGKEVHISFLLHGLTDLDNKIVTTEYLGKAKLAKAGYEQSDGRSIIFDEDYFGFKRREHPTPGPFERAVNGMNIMKIW
jgi:hypothetical protein